MPLLVLASMIGLVDIWRRLEGRSSQVRLGILAVTSLLALFGFVANMGFAVTPNQNWTPQQASHYVDVQKALSNVTGHPLSRDVVRGASFPIFAPRGELFVLGNCDALYVDDQPLPNGYVIFSQNLYWLLVERAPNVNVCRTLIGSARVQSFRTYIAIPGDHTTLSGSHVSLLAQVPSPAKVSSVSFVLDGGSGRAPSTVGSAKNIGFGWFDSWDSRSVPNGTYVLRSVARDTQGHVVTSRGVTINIHNPVAGS